MTTNNGYPDLWLQLLASFSRRCKYRAVTVAVVAGALLLVAPTAQAAVHTVIPGETLWNISSRYDITVDQLKALNNLAQDLIQPGQKLTVPDTAPVPIAVEPVPATIDGNETLLADELEQAPATTPQLWHVVQTGDTLSGIGLQYGVTVEAIMTANCLPSTLIRLGQSLSIPTTTEAEQRDPGSNPPSRGGSRDAATIVELAGQHKGKPYYYGGSGPSSFDCSGFTAYVFAQVGEQLPHNAATQYNHGQPVDKSQLQPGDLVFFGYYGSASIHHVGIYIGNNSFIHASSGRGAIVVDSLANGYFYNNYKGARRL